MSGDGLSVITVVKDDPVGLQATLESVFTQLSQPEYIIVDGNSTDPAMSPVLEEAERRGARVLSEPDRNCYEAMNKGWRLATKRSVAFLNAADRYSTPRATEILTNLAQGERWGYGALQIVTTGGPSIYRFEPFRWRLLASGVKYVPHPSSVVPTKLLEDVGGFDENFGIAADQLLFMRLAAIAPPTLSRHVIATFMLGGLSTRTPEAISYDFHRARQATGSLIAGSVTVDALASRAFAAGRNVLRRVRRRF